MHDGRKTNKHTTHYQAQRTKWQTCIWNNTKIDSIQSTGTPETRRRQWRREWKQWVWWQKQPPCARSSVWITLEPSFRLSCINNNFQVQNMSYVQSYCYIFAHWTNSKIISPSMRLVLNKLYVFNFHFKYYMSFWQKRIKLLRQAVYCSVLPSPEPNPLVNCSHAKGTPHTHTNTETEIS